MRWRQESSVSELNMMTCDQYAERPEQVSAVLPVSDLCKSDNTSPLLKNHPSIGNINTFSETTMDDSNNSDFALITEASQIYEYKWQWLLSKAKSIAKSFRAESDESTMFSSQNQEEIETMTPVLTRTRTFSGPTSKRQKLSKSCESKKPRPKIMRYVQDLSESFENEKVLLEEADESGPIYYVKAQHKLDGQTYILKKQHILVQWDQDIQSHSAYKQILDVKDGSLPTNVRYVNSWVELGSNWLYLNPKYAENGLDVVLVIQMRYVSQWFKLAKDLLLFSPDHQTIDEDELDDMADDAVDDAKALAKDGTKFDEAVTKSFNKIGLQKFITPTTLEQKVWRLCFEDSLNNS